MKLKTLGCTIAAAATMVALPAMSQELKAEVMHNLASPSQQPGLQVLIDAFTARGGTWVDSPIAGGSRARAAMVNRAVAGDPSEVMYVHAQLVFKALADEGLTTSVNPEGWEDWKDKVPASIWTEMLNEKGEVAITPIILGIHNVGFFNSSILERAGASVPADWDELFVTLDKVKALGDVIPLAFTETPIQLFQTLHNITAGVGGSALYDRIYVDHDPTAFDEPAFRDVAETLRKLKPYTDEGRVSRVWQDAGDLVATDQAASMIYGTFALESILTAGMVPGEDLACSNLGGVAVLGPNGFMYGRPDSDAEKQAINLFASMVMDPEVQTAYVAISGGIPSRIDADTSSLDACTSSVMGGLSMEGMNVKDPSMTLNPNKSGGVQDAVVEFWADDNVTVDQFIAKLKAAVQL